MAKNEEKLLEVIRQNAAEFISLESNRTSLITVTRAILSKNGKSATVFFTVYPEKMEEGATDFLKRNQGNLRKFIMEKQKALRVPTLAFELDRGEKNRQRIDELSKEN